MFKVKKPVVVVVIDEIDLLVSNHQSSLTLRPGEEVLRELFQWAGNEELTFGLIGICNSVGNIKSRRLQDLGTVRITIIYPCFSFQTTKKIRV